MLCQKFFSPIHQVVYACLMALLLLLPLETDAQKKNAQKVANPKGYGNASYTAFSFGKPMKNWLVAGPMLNLKEGEPKPDAAKQELFFAADPIATVTVAPAKAIKPLKILDRELAWFAHSAEQAIVDFDKLFQQADFAAAYALAEVKADSSYQTFLALGSDDGVKVWLNGKLIHENWIPRGVVADNDIIPVVLQKGSNQLLIKVQDIELGWGFTARFLDKAGISDRLVVASGKGALDEIDLLIAGGADINKKNAAGLTPLNAAKLAGRKEVINLLLGKGAVETPMPVPEILADQLFTSYSTVEDLFKWNEALYGGKVLSEASMKAALTPVVLNDGSTPPSGGKGYGYGLVLNSYRNHEIVLHGGGLHGFISQLARYPKEDMTVVLLTNVTPTEQHLDPNTLAEYYLWKNMDPQTSYKELAVKEEDLQKYSGRYDFGNGMVMNVTAEDTILYAQLSSQPRFQIYPSAPAEYFWKVVDAKIKFISDQKGNITHGQFQQNGAELKVPRLKEERIVAVDPKAYEALKGTYDFGNNFVVEITTEGDKIFALATNNPKMELLPLSEKEFIVKEFNARLIFKDELEKQDTTLVIDMGGQKREAKKGKK